MSAGAVRRVPRTGENAVQIRLNATLRLHESKGVLSDETSDVLSKSRSVVPPMTKDADLR